LDQRRTLLQAIDEATIRGDVDEASALLARLLSAEPGGTRDNAALPTDAER
jgi:hypothetical protein